MDLVTALMELMSLVGLIAFPVLLGLIPTSIARNKGREFGVWWIYGFLIFIVALPHALLLEPDLRGQAENAKRRGLKKCPYCAEHIRPDARVCKHCGRELGPDAASIPDPPSNVGDQHRMVQIPPATFSFGVIAALATVEGILLIRVLNFPSVEARTFLFSGLFAVAVMTQLTSKRCFVILYWLCFVAAVGSGAGLSLSFAWTSMSSGLLSLCMLLISFGLWRISTDAFSMQSRIGPRAFLLH